MTREVDYDQIGKWSPAFRAIGGPITRFLWRVHLEGDEHIPVDGPAIFAPNHISFIDSHFLSVMLPRPITFVGKAEYLDSWKTRHLFPSLGMIPINRSGGKDAAAALDAAAEVLARGNFFGIYPEGTRSRSGDLHRGRTGVARLSLRTGAPIVPVGIIGTDKIQVPDAPVPKPFMPATLKFGRPIDPARYRKREAKLAYRQLTDEVMFEIAQLTGQRYVDTYAGSTKSAGSAVPKVTADPERHLVDAAAG